MIEWVPFDEILSPPPPPPWVVPGLQLGPGRVSMLYGVKGTAKSLITWSAALSAAAGLPVWGAFEVPRPMTVAIVDFEVGLATARRRVHMIAKGHGIDLRLLRGRLRLISHPRRFDLRAVDDIERSFEGVDLAIIDTLSGATPGADENDRRIRDYIDPMSEASSRTGVTFWMTHHEGASHGRARGSTAIEDACGAVFRLSGTDETKPRSLRQTKVAVDAVEPIAPLELLVEPTHGKAGARVTLKGADDRVAARVIEILNHLRGLSAPTTKEAIADALKGNRTDLFAAMGRMERNGLVRVERSGRTKQVVLSETCTKRDAA